MNKGICVNEVALGSSGTRRMSCNSRCGMIPPIRFFTKVNFPQVSGALIARRVYGIGWFPVSVRSQHRDELSNPDWVRNEPSLIRPSSFTSHMSNCRVLLSTRYYSLSKH